MGSSISQEKKINNRADDSLKHQLANERINQITQYTNKVTYSDNELLNVVSIIHPHVPLLDIAKKQMERRDKPLTKADLISIILLIAPNKELNPHVLNKLTVKELTLMMRLIIYDPERCNDYVSPSFPPIETCAILSDEPIYAEAITFEETKEQNEK
jgi:hypothetical protein